MGKLVFSTSALALALMAAPAAFAQDQDDEIIVTATSIGVTQGGAQDIEFFKESVDNGYLPAPAAITSEGLLSEYNLPIAGTDACDQLFCLVSETIKTDFISNSKTDHLVGLGFATNLTHETWEREPLSIVAVVDKSGSMGGEPLDLAKASMQEVLKNLRPGDQMAVVQYGSTVNVVVPMMEVGSKRADIADGIASIESGGSTYMEAGLKLAYKTAFDAQRAFVGTSRVVLFTDEQPNVGDTDSESFIGMAVAASKRGVGLTTIGVADHFGADLANKLSAARGGNLFFVTDEEDVGATFGGDFDLMMTELAHDLEIKVKPAKGQAVAEVFGVPGDLVTYDKKGGAKIKVPSVFLSSKSGGIYFGLSGTAKSAPDLDVNLSYVEVRSDRKASDALKVSGAPSAPSPAMQRAHFLVDEYQILQTGTRAAFFGGDMTKALSDVGKLLERLETMDDDAVYAEAEFLEDFEYVLEEYRDDAADREEELLAEYDPADRDSSPVYGKWKVAKVRDRSTSVFGGGSIDIRRGDLLAFHLDDDRYDETEMFNLHRLSAKRGEAEYEAESFSVNPQKRQIRLFESDIDFEYRYDGNQLRLYPNETELVLILERI